MSKTAISIAILAGLFAIGTILRFVKSPTDNPLARLAKDGVMGNGVVIELEPDGDEPNVLLEYEVNGQKLRRSVPWNPNKPLPEIGASLLIRYLPDQPGISRLA